MGRGEDSSGCLLASALTSPQLSPHFLRLMQSPHKRTSPLLPLIVCSLCCDFMITAHDDDPKPSSGHDKQCVPARQAIVRQEGQLKSSR